MMATGRWRAPSEPTNNQFLRLEKQFPNRAYRHLVMEGSIGMTCETMPRPRIIQIVASRQTLVGFHHRLSHLPLQEPKQVILRLVTEGLARWCLKAP